MSPPSSPFRARRGGGSRWQTGLSLGALVLSICWLWRAQLSGQVTHIGNVDRLVGYLSNELFNYDSVAQYRRFVAWDDRVFAGVNAAALPSFGTNLTPLKLLMPWLSRPNFFYGASFLPAGMMLAAALAAFWALRSVACPMLAALGAVLYTTAVFAQLNFSQIDTMGVVLIFLPIGAGILETRARRPSTLLLLTICALPIVYFGFTPQADYVIGFLALLAATRALREKRWWPVILFIVAGSSALCLCLPRLLAVVAGIFSVQRGISGGSGSIPFSRLQEFFNITPREFWRALDDGIFGRFPQETVIYNNNFNLNEGFQIYSSTLATLIVLKVLVRYRGQWLGVFRPRHGFVAACSWTLLGVVAVVFFKPATYVVYLLFLRAPVFHARIVIIGLLPMAVLVAAGLQEWLDLAGDVSGRFLGRNVFAGAVLGTAASYGLSRFENGRRAAQEINASTGIPFSQVLRSTWELAWHPAAANSTADKSLHYDGTGNLWLHAASAEKIGLCLFIFVGIMVLLAWPRGRAGGRAIAACSFLALFAASQALQEADLRANGPQTRTFPQAFLHDNFFNAPRSVLRPPDERALARMHDRLHPERWRVAFVTPAGAFSGFAAPLVAQLWQLRMVEGYSTGVPQRFVALPWPPDTLGFRSLAFQNLGQMPWALLGAMNVRYAVTINQALYFNLPGADDLEIVENPLPVTPRVFFAARTTPAIPFSADRPKSDSMPPAPERESWVEGETRSRDWPIGGKIDADFQGDHIVLSLEPSPQPRFLVLNESFHPYWSASLADGRTLPVFAVNTVMRGIEIPGGADKVTMDFRPPDQMLLRLGGGLAALAMLLTCWKWLRNLAPGT
jgi:hypothetical protein